MEQIFLPAHRPTLSRTHPSRSWNVVVPSSPQLSISLSLSPSLPPSSQLLYGVEERESDSAVQPPPPPPPPPPPSPEDDDDGGREEGGHELPQKSLGGKGGKGRKRAAGATEKRRNRLIERQIRLAHTHTPTSMMQRERERGRKSLKAKTHLSVRRGLGRRDWKFINNGSFLPSFSSPRGCVVWCVRLSIGVNNRMGLHVATSATSTYSRTPLRAPYYTVTQIEAFCTIKHALITKHKLIWPVCCAYVLVE